MRKLEKNSPGLRFVVFVDDTDRLEPSEATEVLRLVRHAVNLPLLVYVACLMRGYFSQVKQFLNVKNPRDYLDKIFDTTVPIPPQEPFALRRQLRSLLSRHFPEAAGDDPDASDRDSIVFDTWGGKLIKTPETLAG